MAKILIRTSDEIKQQLISIAKSKGLTLTSLLRLIISEWLERR